MWPVRVRSSADGKVGAIGGLQQKIASADEAGATVFLVPEVNCRDLAGLDTDLKLVKVATLGEAIDAVGAVAQSGPVRRNSHLPLTVTPWHVSRTWFVRPP